MEILWCWLRQINLDVVSARCMLTVAILIAALTLNEYYQGFTGNFMKMCFWTGDWIVILIHVLKQYGIVQHHYLVDENTVEDTLAKLHLQNLSHFWLSSMTIGYGIYFLAALFFHFYYYVQQRDQPEAWKCQPKKWMSAKLEWDAITVGSITLFMCNTWSALLACYIYNGGHCTLYYQWNQYGIIWLIWQIPLVFIYQDYLTYWIHRFFHTPHMYKRFHKLHHKYEQPTAFTATAMHPFEIAVIQTGLVLPIFIVPVHWVAYHTLTMYIYYHGMITHSGVNFRAKWWQPWQPDAIFHDNHHQYYHVNFGFNCWLWDKLHNTYRKPNRVYNENTYYGGKPAEEISREELEKEIRERETESKTAYKDGYNPFLLESLKLRAKIRSRMTEVDRAMDGIKTLSTTYL